MSFRVSGLIFLAVLLGCKSPGLSPVSLVQFSADPTATAIAPGLIDEASGMTASRSMPGNLWIAQDSGNPAELALLGYDGKVKGKISLPDGQNIDWEDMAGGPGPQAGVHYLYVGDIGDNAGEYGSRTIYRLPEPASLNAPIPLQQVDRINYRYPDGPRDAEALILDPQTRDLYIISKRESRVRLYRLKYPQKTNEQAVAEALGELPLSVVTGASISSDGTEILIRTYTNVYHYKRKEGQTLADAVQLQAGRPLPYRLEPQGEAVAFDSESKGFFTLSERFNAAAVSLFYYARK